MKMKQKLQYSENVFACLILQFCMFCFLHSVKGTLPQEFIKEPTDVTASHGDTVLLDCVIRNIRGAPQWTYNGFGLGTDRDLPGYPRKSMTGTHGNYSLRIRSVQVVDEGAYQCQVSKAAGVQALRSRQAFLTVNLKPNSDSIRLDVSGSTVNGTEGRPIRLTCTVGASKPASKISWFINGEEQKQGINSTTHQYPNSLLSSAKSWIDLKPESSHNGANVSCLVSHPALGEPATRNVTLSVRYAPKASVTPDSVVIKEGDNVRFTCKTEANPSETQYSWQLGDQAVPGEFGSSFEIKKIERSLNNVSVTCIASNAVGTTNNSHAISVQYRPVFLSEPADVDEEQGKEVTLKCDIHANPEPKVVWTHEESQKVIGIGKEMILTVDKDTTGMYHCRAATAGFPEISGSLEVFMRGPPDIADQQQSFGLEGEIVEVECLIKSIPRPWSVTWSRSDQRVILFGNSKYEIGNETTKGGIRSILLIRGAESYDFGMYNCSATNEYGSDLAFVVLKRKQTLPLVTTLVAIIGAILFLIIVSVVIFLFKKKGAEYKDPQEKISVRSSDRSSSSSAQKSDSRTGSGSGTGTVSETTPSDDEDYSQADWETSETGNSSRSRPCSRDPFRYSDNFTDPILPLKNGGPNNNTRGYIPYVDYKRDYAPPALPAPNPANFNRNSLYSPVPLNNLDPRFSATYGNPYLRVPTNSKSYQNIYGSIPPRNTTMAPAPSVAYQPVPSNNLNNLSNNSYAVLGSSRSNLRSNAAAQFERNVPENGNPGVLGTQI